VINPLTRLVAGWLPGFAILSHVGRTSGRTYRIPINVFRRGDHYLFALTYGSDVDWVKNVRAAGGCLLRSRGRASPPCLAPTPTFRATGDSPTE
jgi:deazaflavin-dependent oxidoreductase (nitroreductase family)